MALSKNQLSTSCACSGIYGAGVLGEIDGDGEAGRGEGEAGRGASCCCNRGDSGRGVVREGENKGCSCAGLVAGGAEGICSVSSMGTSVFPFLILSNKIYIH